MVDDHLPVWRTVPPKQCWYRRRDNTCSLYDAWYDDGYHGLLKCPDDNVHPDKCPTEIKPERV